MELSFAMGRTPWQQPAPSDVDVETRARVERVLALARVLFATITLAAIYLDPHDVGSSESLAYELLTAYVSFSAIIMIVARLAPAYLLRAGLGIHLVDVLFAAVITFLTRGSGSGAFIFFVFVLFATPVRWGLTAAIGTAVAVIVLFVAEAQLMPPADTRELAITGPVMRTSYRIALLLMLGFTALQNRAFRTESNAVSRVLAGVCGASSFSDGLRLFIDECLVHVGSRRALVAVENTPTQRLYLWTAHRSDGWARSTLTLQDLAAGDRQTYFAKPSRDLMVCHVRRRKNGFLVARGLGATTLETLIPTAGSFMRAVLDRHAATSALVADATPAPEWNVRIALLDPRRTSLDAFYFLRNLVRQVEPALHSKYLIRRVRSRVGATERARLARELHDGLLQSLIGLEMEIEAVRRTVDVATESRLRSVRDQLRHDIADVRDFMLQLRLVEITDQDLLRIIAELSGRLRRETSMEVRVVSNGSFVKCAPRNCAHLARIVQEALTNIRKHSGARSVTISVADTPAGGRVTIQDDGRGFRFKGRLTQEQLEANDLGPAVLRERVRAMGGQLAIESTPGSGARIEVEWPQVANV